MPSVGETANIVFTDGVARTVTYNVNAPSLGLLTIDLTGPGTTTSTLSMPNSNTLNANGILVGGYSGITSSPTSGRGAIIQSAGTASTNAGWDLVVGYGANSTGNYTLSGGAFIANQSEFVGYAGTGTFTHTVGSNTINANAVGSFVVGYLAGSTGTYNLSGTGTLLTATHQYVGYSGNGTFNQSAGTNTISGGKALYLGYEPNSTGSYYLSGATSVVNSSGVVAVGNKGAGTLDISAGGKVTSTGGGFVGGLPGSSGTATIAGAGSKWTNNTGDFHVGSGGTGNLTISNGGSLATSNFLMVGYANTGVLNITGGGSVSNAGAGIGFAAVGTVNVSGTNSTWTNSSFLEVGHDGTGTLNISNGGRVSNVDSYVGFDDAATGTVTVTGAGSQWNNSSTVAIGYAATGTLSIEAGGSVTSVGGGFVGGLTADASGTATITGAGSTWTNNGGEFQVGSGGTGNLAIADRGSLATNHFLTVGYTNTGVLSISGGGSVSNTLGRLGVGAGTTGSVTVTGAGSTWTNSGSLTIGDDGTGNLTISEGGTVSNTNEGFIGFDDGAGTVTVTGSGSLWNSSQIAVGYGGTGTLNIEEGGNVASTGGGFIGGLTAGASGTATITGAGSTWTNTNGDFQVGSGGAGNLAIADGGSLATSNFLFVGFANTGVLSISGGGSISNAGAGLAFGAGTSGTVTVSGAGSTWTNSAFLEVGHGGSGTLNISDGGAVSNTDGYISFGSNSSGAVTVGGAGSQWTNTGTLNVGGLSNNTGTGAVTILPGGTVSVGTGLKIWNKGTANLFGGTLHFATSASYSREPTGTFNFGAGTIQLAGNRLVGADPIVSTFFGSSPVIPTAKGLDVEGTATLVAPVTINGGTFTVGDIDNTALLTFQRGTFRMTAANLVISAAGKFGPTLELVAGQHYVVDNTADLDTDGLLLIASGSSFTAGLTDNAGEIVLSGATARLSGGALDNTGLVRGEGRIDAGLTNLASGEVRIGPGQRLVFTNPELVNQGQINVVAGTLGLLNGITNDAAINLTGGTADVYGNIGVGSTGRISVGNSTTATLFGNIAQNGTVNVAPDSHAIFFGNVTGSGSFPLTGSIEFLGAVSPGNSAGAMSFGGEVSLSARLNIELAGAAPGTQYDRLLVAGPLSLGGALAISLINGFTPQAGNSFDILDWATVSGTFSSLSLPSLQSSLAWDTSQLYTTGVLAVVSALPGDFNVNGTVDVADYVVWRKGLGTVYSPLDYNLWRAHFGQTIGSGTAVATIPEPPSIALLIAMLAVTATRRLLPRPCRILA